jgi:hypothetical protein
MTAGFDPPASAFAQVSVHVPEADHGGGDAQTMIGIAGWVAGGHTSGLVVLVARRGVIVLHEALGRLRPEADASSLPRDALFPSQVNLKAIQGLGV